jgi:hypothetical protein
MRPKTRTVLSKKAKQVIISLGVAYFLALIAWDIHGEIFNGTTVAWGGGTFVDGHYQVIEHNIVFDLRPGVFWANYSLCWLTTVLGVLYILALLYFMRRGEIRKVAIEKPKPRTIWG